MNIKHTGKRQEDYLETILILSEDTKGVKVRDLAAKLDLNKSTIVPMIEKLTKEGLVKHEKYGDIFLTPKGVIKAQSVYKKHLGLLSFLRDILKLPVNIAQTDACNLEHYISDITIEQLIKFVEFFKIKIARNNKTFKQLEDYYETGNYICEKHEQKDIINLSLLKASDKAVVLKLDIKESIKNSYFLLGIQPGTIITVTEVSKKYIQIHDNSKGNSFMDIPIKECKNILVEKI